MNDKTHRSAITGEFVTAEHAAENPDTTVSESPCAECERLRGVNHHQGVAIDFYREEVERLRAEPVVRTVGDLTPRHVGRRVRIVDPYAPRGDSEGEMVGIDVELDFITVWLDQGTDVGCTIDTPCEVLP